MVSSKVEPVGLVIILREKADNASSIKEITTASWYTENKNKIAQ